MHLSKARLSTDFVALGNLGICKALDRSEWAARFRALSAECIKLSEVSPDRRISNDYRAIAERYLRLAQEEEELSR
jgi:hypothetical protein